MDKYEFNIKVEQIKKLVSKGDYETAMKIADTIDWRRVRSTSLLTMVAQVYECNKEYQSAKDILLLAFERAPIGRSLLFKLTDLALREGNVSEAEAYYREFCDLSADDPRQNLLRYLILEAKDATIEQRINSLERYCQSELDEKWMYRLAELYQKVGQEEACVKMCDKIMLLFGLGKYVDKAMELKLQYAPLTKYQMDLVDNREKYEEKLREVEQRFDRGMYRPAEEDYDDSEEIKESDEKKEMPDDSVAKLHEAEAEEDLAKEMSKLEPYDEETDESSVGETRVLESIQDMKQIREAAGRKASALAARESAAAKDTGSEQAEVEEDTIIEDLDLDLDDENSNHLMIEAEDAASGLSLALDSLRKIHKELGTKNPVAKISGEKLRKRGLFTVADRLTGKDLVVEHAAELDDLTVDELNELMERDQTGIIVVLIDTPSRMELFHEKHPGLAGKFQYIGCDTSNISANRKDESKHQEEKDEEQKAYEAEQARKRLAEREEEIRRQAARDAEELKRRQIAHEEQEEKRLAEEQARAEAEAKRLAQYRQETASTYEEELPENSMDENEASSVDVFQAREDKNMDVEEFAQYACKYASEIDCSISGKSMLALYERAEMMEEDGIALTKAGAEDLIEDAADKAEKRSFGGMFSSKYDKDGLLILKEKHFFD